MSAALYAAIRSQLRSIVWGSGATTVVRPHSIVTNHTTRKFNRCSEVTSVY